jgi:hypothetical protein
MAFRFNALTGQLDLVNSVTIPPGTVTSGSGSSVNNEVATFSGTSGSVIQTTPATIDSSGNLVTPGTVTAAEIIDEGLTPNTAVYADSGSQLASSPTTSTELGYVHGVTSAIQTQLNALQPALTPGSISTSTTGVTVGNGSSSTVGPNVTVNVQTASATQSGLLDAADWNTFNNKQTSGNYITALTGDVTASGPGSAVASLTATSNSTLTTLSSLNLPYSQLSGTVPTWNQNTTGTAANITATSNSTLTSLPSLSLPGSQVTGNISGNAANITATSNNTLTSLPSLVLPGSQVSGNIAGSAGSVSGTNVITNSNLAQMPANTILGNNTGSTANAADLTATQVTAMLNPFVGDTGSGGTQGLVPAPAAGTRAAGDFLSANGTWAYVDQSTPLYNPFSFIGITPWTGSTSAKFENIATYTGIDGHKQYAAIVAGGGAGTLFIWDITDPGIPVLCSFIVLSGAYNLSIAKISGAIYAFIPSSGATTLYTINITNPYSLTTTSSLTISGSPGSLYSCV